MKTKRRFSFKSFNIEKSYATFFNAMDVEFKQFRAQQDPTFRGKIKENDGFAQAFRVLVNYWEIKPNQYESRLHEMALKDIRAVCAFVPWSHVETDIYHLLKKFLKAAHQAKIKVSLYVMPELGINYPSCGIPKEILQNHGNLAVGRRGQVIYNYAAPNIFPLPSFFSSDVLKRFGNFLIKFGSILGEVFQEVGQRDFCEIVVSNTLFNYYRSFGLKPQDHGDYSAAHVMTFREFLDRDFPGGAGEPFKMQAYEGQNRHRFFSHVERLLREKTEMIFSRKSSQVSIRHIGLINPECSPEMGYQSLLTELYDFKPSVERFYQAIVAAGERGDTTFLNSSGVFRRFNDQEKCFLIMAGFIHTGEVVMSYDEMNRLSPSFQKKLQGLIHILKDQNYIPHRRMVYISSSKFSMHETCYQVLARMVPGVMSLSSSVAEEASTSARHYGDTASGAGDLADLGREAMRHNKRLVFVDPQAIMRMIDVVQLFSLAQYGKVVAIPAPSTKLANYLPDALTHLEKFRKIQTPMKLNLGVAYDVYEYHLGFIVVYNPEIHAEPSPAPGIKSGLVLFFQALLGLADIKSICQVNDPRIHVVSYVSQIDSNDRLLFLVNSSREEIHAQLSFSETVGLAALNRGSELGEAIVGQSFELAVPPLGVLSMKLAEAGVSEAPDQSHEEPLLWN